jgi:hypothetical protein
MSPKASTINRNRKRYLFLIIVSSGFIFKIEKYAPRQKKRIVCGIKAL